MTARRRNQKLSGVVGLPRMPRLGRHDHPLPPPQRNGHVRRFPAQTQAAAPAALELIQRVRPRARQHQGDDAGRRRAHARRGRSLARGSAAVLCGGYEGDAAVGDYGEWLREIWFFSLKKPRFVPSAMKIAIGYVHSWRCYLL